MKTLILTVALLLMVMGCGELTFSDPWNGVVCYPDGKYGWIGPHSDGSPAEYRSISVFDTKEKAQRDFDDWLEKTKNGFPKPQYDRDKYTTWEKCDNEQLNPAPYKWSSSGFYKKYNAYWDNKEAN